MQSSNSSTDRWLWGADYSQLELRIFARVSRCRAMIDVFSDPKGDIHAETCRRVFGISSEDLKGRPEIRVRGKTLNFGIAYGAEAGTVQETILKVALRTPELNIPIPSLSECQEMVKGFWAAYPECREWVEWAKEETRDKGYAEDIYGRRRYLPGIRHPSSDMRARAERQSVNHRIQGPAGTVTKNAQLMLWREAPNYSANLLLQVHDELVGEIDAPRDTRERWLRTVKEYMELGQPLAPVPLFVEPRLVRNWRELK